jgi:plastocyanin
MKTMKMRLLGVVLSLVVCLLALPVVVGAATGTPPASPAASPGASPAASPSASPVASPAASPAVTAEVTVHIKDFFMDPGAITVKPGTKVTWINDGPTIHTTTSTSEPKLWDSGILQVGQKFSYVFATAGTYPYWCSLHPQMVGKVIAKA